MNPETAVIGSIILSQGTALDELTLEPAEFNNPKLGRVYQTLRQMRESHEAIDALTLTAKLPEHNMDIWDWQSSTPTAENVSYYARIVREQSVRRSVSDTAQNILYKIQESD